MLAEDGGPSSAPIASGPHTWKQLRQRPASVLDESYAAGAEASQLLVGKRDKVVRCGSLACEARQRALGQQRARSPQLIRDVSSPRPDSPRRIARQREEGAVPQRPADGKHASHSTTHRKATRRSFGLLLCALLHRLARSKLPDLPWLTLPDFISCRRGSDFPNSRALARQSCAVAVTLSTRHRR